MRSWFSSLHLFPSVYFEIFQLFPPGAQSKQYLTAQESRSFCRFLFAYTRDENYSWREADADTRSQPLGSHRVPAAGDGGTHTWSWHPRVGLSLRCLPPQHLPAPARGGPGQFLMSQRGKFMARAHSPRARSCRRAAMGHCQLKPELAATQAEAERKQGLSG